jgi:hypothetical protein
LNVQFRGSSERLLLDLLCGILFPVSQIVCPVLSVSRRYCFRCSCPSRAWFCVCKSFCL